MRSPTAEVIFASETVETSSAGISPEADTSLDAETIEWADVVLFMEAAHQRKAAERFSRALRDKRLVCLRIPDDYEYMEPALITLLQERVGRVVPQVKSPHA